MAKKELVISLSPAAIPAALLIALIGVLAANSVILAQIAAPTPTGQILGNATQPLPQLELTAIVASDCAECFDIEQYVTTLKQVANITDEKTLTAEQADELISTLGIDRLPALVIKGEIEQADFLAQVAQFKDESAIILSPPPYLNLSTGNVKGLVDIIYLNDSSCVACYDAGVHKPIIQQFGITIANETMADVSSTDGQVLIQKYNITAVPTILLSPEAAAYPTLQQAWTQVGSIENDGWWVFRDTQFMIQAGGYKNLTSGQFVNATLNTTGG